MPINPAIAMGTRGIELADPLAQYGRVAAIQNAQQQNQLAQLQMQEYARGREEEQAIRNRLTGGASLEDPETRNFLLSSKSGRDILQRQADLQKANTEEAARRAKLMTDTENMYRNMASQIGSKQDAAVFLRNMVNDPALKDSPISRIPLMDQVARIPDDAQGLDNWIKQFAIGSTKWVTENKPVTFAQDLGAGGRLMSRPGLGGAATVVPGSEFTKTMAPGEAQRLQNEATRIRQEGQRLGLEGRRVAVLESNARRDADPMFQQQMAAAKATGEAIAKGDVAAQQALPKVIGRAQEGLRLIDEMVGKPEVRDASGKVVQAGTKPMQGFQGAVGATWLPGARFVPGTDEANFMARFDQLKGASFLEAFESLKGGGAITEKEGAKATDAINRMSISTDEKEFMSAARDLQEVIRKGVENAQRKAGGAARGAPAGGGVDMNNPLLK
jgi:hypothetical protein